MKSHGKKTVLVIASVFVFLFAAGQEDYYFFPSPASEDDDMVGDLQSITPMTNTQKEDASDIDLNPQNDFALFDGNLGTAGLNCEINKTNSVYNVPLSYGFNVNFIKNENIKERLSLSAAIPWVRKSLNAYSAEIAGFRDYKTSGIGDICIKARYSLHFNKILISPGISVKVPTGKSDNAVDDLYIPLGSGSLDVGLSLQGQRKFGNISYDANIVYNILGAYKLNETEFTYGEQLMLTVRGSYLKFKKLTGGVSAIFYASSNSIIKFKDINGVPGENEIPGMKLVDITPYIRIALPWNISLTLKTAIPVVTKFKDAAWGEITGAKRAIKFGVTLQAYIFSYNVK